MKTPLKVIFKVLCQQGLVETMGEGAYEDDRPEDPRQNNHEEVCASTEHTRWNPIIYRSARWVPRLYIESGATRHSGPFPYKSDKAVPWKYQGKSVAESKQTEEVIINASKGKEKIVETSEDRPEPEVTELFPEKMEREVSEEEACEFLRFIKQSEYQVIDQLSRTPAKVSLLSLLMNSEAHREVLFKVLNRAHVNHDISTDKLGGIIKHHD
ncbi:hypothetical protein Lal_00001006 [Lupinus albus]|nr:hypothetical protein Lal_00001006 [Lupinus albus]